MRISPDFKKKLLRWAIIALLATTLFSAIKAAWEQRRQNSPNENDLSSLVRIELEHQMSITMMPLLSFLDDRDAAVGVTAYLEQALTKQMPVYYYSEQIYQAAPEIEDARTRDLLIREEGGDEALKNIPEDDLDYDNDALHFNNNTTTDTGVTPIDEEPLPIDDPPPDGNDRNDTMYLETERLDALLAENRQAAPRTGTDDPAVNRPLPGSNWVTMPFAVPDHPAYNYDWSEGFGYRELITNFYAIDALTAIDENRINLDNLLRRDLTIKPITDQPQILIYHTHSQEGFADSTPGDRSTTIVGAGARLANLLREQYGFNVLHHTGEYDVESRDYAYSNSLPEIERLLAEHPSIEVVIDLHRDEMAAGNRLVMDLQGRPTARFMFFNGISYTKQTGAIDYLVNENLDVNLAFSFQAQVVANEYYPGLARKIYLRAYRYNMHLMPRYTLIELGEQNNTVEEIMNACDPLAHIIATVLTGND